jgi:hypothetical protein
MPPRTSPLTPSTEVSATIALTRVRVAGGVRRLAQVRDRARVAGLRLDAPGEHQQRAQALARGRLGERPAQQPRRGLGSAAGRGRVGRRGQRVDDPRLPGRVDLEQVRGRPLRLHAHLGERLRRVPVQPHPLRRRDAGDHRRAYEGMRERGRPSGGEQPDALKGIERVVRVRAVHQRGDMRRLCVVAEHRHRPGDRGRVRPHQLEPAPDSGGEAVRDDLADPGGRRGRRLDAGLGERALVHVEQQRVAARGGMAGGGELGVGVAEQQADRGDAQRARPDHPRRRRPQDRGDQGFVCARLVRPQRDAHLGVDAVDPREQIRERSQRRRIGPVQVIDR